MCKDCLAGPYCGWCTLENRLVSFQEKYCSNRKSCKLIVVKFCAHCSVKFCSVKGGRYLNFSDSFGNHFNWLSGGIKAILLFFFTKIARSLTGSVVEICLLSAHISMKLYE